MFERKAKGFLNLRGTAAGLRVGVANVLGVELPTEPCTFARAEAVAAYWLGPDEWLAMVPNDGCAQLATRLRDTLVGHFSIVDVSGGHVLFNLGAEVVPVLEKSSPCDFHTQVFPPGRCVRTRFARIHALIAANPDRRFDLIVAASYADYVQRWIERVM